MNRVRRALVLSTVERYITLAANFFALAIVSRLLTPAEIGVSVLGMAVIALALSLREFAATNFIVQHKDLKLEDVQTTFTVVVLVTVVISSAILAAASSVATYFEEPGLAPYLRVLSMTILVEVIAFPIAALLRREMAFDKLAIINVSGVTVSVALTITLAYLGFSYMSFAWSTLAAASTVSFLSLMIWTDWAIFRPCLRAWRGVATFGWYNGNNILLFRIYDYLPYLVLGRILSIEAIGLYNRGITISQLPDKVFFSGIYSVLLSAFSAETRKGRGLRESYLHSAELITAVQWPALILLAILAEPVVYLLIGEQWTGSVPIVRILAIAMLFSYPAELAFPVLVAVGAMNDVLKRGLIAWPISAVITTCAAFYGLEAAALSWLVTMPIQAFISIYFVRRHVDVHWHEIAKALQKSAVLALTSAVGPLAVVFLMGGSFDLSILATALAVILGALGWAVGLWLTAHPLLKEIGQAASFTMNVVPLWKKSKEAPDKI